jgi:DNA-binding SARP family transcriptional activator/tetratricopeptide (TPR) repeat protein
MNIALLGEVTAQVDGRMVDLGPPRQRCVLAALAVDAGRLVPAERLMGRVWGANTPRRGRATLHSHISRLRGAFAGTLTIVHRSDGYTLVMDQAVDLLRFRALRDQARSTGEDSRKVTLLTEALALWRGEPLTGLSGEWVERERDRWQQERWAAEHDLIDAQLHIGHGEELVPQLSTRTAQYPLDEHAASQYMLALHRAGRTADALDFYRQLRQRLVAELGTDPGAAVQDLHRQILDADPSLLPEPAGDATEPMALRRPRELPPDTFGFTGRAEQLAELDRLYALSAQHPTAPAIVVLSGTAGVGKTALAVHWAHRSLHRFPDGQLHLNLHGYAPDRPMPPTEALVALLRSFGISGPELPPSQDDQARLYRTLIADQRVLIVLDNALDVDQVRDLLPGAPGCLVLVTSRDSLGGIAVHHGGHLIEVPPLSQHETQDLLRVHLSDRATAAPTATAALADQCARLPLALRIVAQRAAARPTVTLAELVTELADEHHRLDLLDSGESHSSARAVFSWSYRQLPGTEAQLFRLLGVLPGRDIDLHGLTALTGTDLRFARQAVAGLVRRHLMFEIARDRFAMHDLLRVYAKQQAADQDDPDVRDAALSRLFDYYLNATALAMAKFSPWAPYRPKLPKQTTEFPVIDSREAATAWLDAERSNLVAAGMHAADHGWPSHASHLSAILHPYLSRGAYWADATLLYGATTDIQDVDGNRPGLINYGAVLFHTGRLRETLEHFQNAVTLVQKTGGSQRDEARLLINLGIVYSRLGRQPEAIDLTHRALDIFREFEDSYLEAKCLENLGQMHQRCGEYLESLEFQRHALTIFQEFDDPYGEADVRSNLGVTCSQLGRHDEAFDHQQRALAILRVIDDRQGEAATLNDIGTTLRLAGSPRKAIERHQQALARATEIGDQYDQANAHDGAAQSYLALGDLDNARANWRTALELHTRLGTSQVERITMTLQNLDQPR